MCRAVTIWTLVRKSTNVQKYNLACCFVWVWNLVAYIEGGTWTEGFREQGAERDICAWQAEVTVDWRKLHNEELHDLYSLPNNTKAMEPRRVRLIVHVAGMEEKMDVNRDLAEIPERKKPFGRPKRRWEDNKLDLKEIRWECMNWFNLSRNRNKWRAVVNTGMNI